MSFLREETRSPLLDQSHPLWYGTIAETITSLSEMAYITLPDSGADTQIGPCRWQSRDNGSMPQRGDNCIVAFDSRSQPWIMAWWPQVFQTFAAGVPTGVFNVKAFNAVGNGIHDDTSNIDNAESARAAINGILYFPAGRYIYNGTGVDATQPYIMGAGRGASTIVLGAGSSFINASAPLSRLHVSGVTFSGGKDVIKSTWTGENVIYYAIVEDCEFFDYTGAAISDNAFDFPYWKINRSVFRGANYTTTMGIALSGLMDASSITDCDFEGNRIHIKLRHSGNNVWISNCDFLRFATTQGQPRIDIWVVPGATSYQDAGAGMTVMSTKFGNENFDVADYKVVFADEDTSVGTDNATYMPKLSADSTGFISGITFRDCRTDGIPTPRPFIYSTTPNVNSLIVGPLIMIGGTISYLLEYRTVPDMERNIANILFGPFYGPGVGVDLAPNVPQLSNVPGYALIDDPFSVMDVRPNLPISRPGSSDPADFVKLLPLSIRNFNLVTATTANVADAFGGIDASEITYTTIYDYIYAGLTMANIRAGDTALIEFDLKIGSSSPLTQLKALILRESDAHIYWQRMLYVPPNGWHRFRYPICFETAVGQTDLLFRPNGVETGKVQISRVRVYHAREPQNDGTYPIASGVNRIFSGTGVPAAGQGANGDFYFRIDTPGTANQRLYVKSVGAWIGIL